MVVLLRYQSRKNMSINKNGIYISELEMEVGMKDNIVIIQLNRPLYLRDDEIIFVDDIGVRSNCGDIKEARDDFTVYREDNKNLRILTIGKLEEIIVKFFEKKIPIEIKHDLNGVCITIPEQQVDVDALHSYLIDSFSTKRLS